MAPFITTPAAATQIIRRGVRLRPGAQPAEGFVPDVERDQDQRQSVDEGRQHAGAVVAEGLARARARRPCRYTAPHDISSAREVGEVVTGFGEQRQAVRAKSGDYQQEDVDQRDYQRNTQNARGFLVTRVDVDMHALSLKGVWRRFNP